MKKKTGKELSFITVMGQDRKGIVASVSQFLYKNEINIEDISQKIIEGYFVMTMLVDIANAAIPLEKLRDGLDGIGKKLRIKITIQHENIFKMMHRV
ncbi:MAG: ACT domain-containing protein [Spirochaetes bacterium]|nr:ACT domain-containing protein [Spirochaetota bacterium]